MKVVVSPSSRFEAANILGPTSSLLVPLNVNGGAKKSMLMFRKAKIDIISCVFALCVLCIPSISGQSSMKEKAETLGTNFDWDLFYFPNHQRVDFCAQQNSSTSMWCFHGSIITTWGKRCTFWSGWWCRRSRCLRSHSRARRLPGRRCGLSRSSGPAYRDHPSERSPQCHGYAEGNKDRYGLQRD